MSTATLVSVEEFLSTSYEAPEPDYVDGEIVERGMPDRLHMLCVQRFAEVFGAIIRSKQAFGGPEWRLRLSPEQYRTADYSIYRSDPMEDYPSSPAWVVVEVVSRDDSHAKLRSKLGEYRQWGAENIWVVEPRSRSLSVFDSKGLREVESLELPEIDLSISPADLFDA